jgi:hypothetical protein
MTERAEIQVQIFRVETELIAEIADRFFQPHQGQPDRLGLVGAQRPGLHPSNRLPLENLPDELHQREHQFADGTAHVVRIRIPARRRRSRQTIEFRTQVLDLENFDRAGVSRRSVRRPLAGGPLPRARPGNLAPRLLHDHRSGVNAKGGHGPLMSAVGATPARSCWYCLTLPRSMRW